MPNAKKAIRNETNYSKKFLGSAGFHAATSRANLATMLRPLESVLDCNFIKDFGEQNFTTACTNFNLRSGSTFLDKEERIEFRSFKANCKEWWTVRRHGWFKLDQHRCYLCTLSRISLSHCIYMGEIVWPWERMKLWLTGTMSATSCILE